MKNHNEMQLQILHEMHTCSRAFKRKLNILDALDRDNEFDLHDQITLMKESNEKIADTLSKSRTMMSNILGISNEHDIESG